MKCLSMVPAVVGLAALGLLGCAALAEEAPAQPEGVETLARGPVHEAYAQPVTAHPEPGPVLAKKPPEPIEELPPEQKPEGDNVQWIPGYWAWDEDTSDYIWISGFWRVPPPGCRWLPGHWQEVDKGWMWVAGFWGPANVDEVQVQYLPPPPPSVDQGPSTPAPDATSSYVPGCWIYDQTRYLWRPGHWIAYRPNWIWVPAHYVWTPSGCIFIDGYWDHPLDECGLLFAPVRFGPRWWALRRPFIPQFVVKVDFLMGALFIGPAFHHYYFGDYFEERYAKRGFVAWVDYRRGKSAYDPYFDYYRHQHAAEPRWEAGLRELYRGRRAGEVPRPPRTLGEQTQALKTIAVNKTENVAVHKNINITHVQNVTALAPLKEVHNTQQTNLGSLSQVKESKISHPVVKLENVPKEEHAREQKAAAQIRDLGVQRHNMETKILSQGGVPVQHTDPPKPAKLTVPKPPAPVSPARPVVKQPPPAPALPKHVEMAIPKYEPHKPPGPPKK
jgi:hypothetical protein